MDETGNSSVLLVARCLLAGLFLWSGIGKTAGYDEAGQFMAQHGTIGLLLPVAIVVEIGRAASADRRPEGEVYRPGACRLLRGDGAAVSRQLHRRRPDGPFPEERRAGGCPARTLRLGARTHVVRRHRRGG